MAKPKRSKSPEQAEEGASDAAGAPEEAAAVLSLRMDASTPEAPREVNQAEGAFKTPCTFVGLGAGLSGGTLGWVFGFGGYWISNIRGGKFRASMDAGWSSAKTFGIMGGLYAAVSCFMQRIRQKNDAWNGAASGCATGLALGWSQGPWGALQSCAMLGGFSFFIDSMAGAPAEAATAAGAASAAQGLGNESGGRAGDACWQQAGQQLQQGGQQWQAWWEQQPAKQRNPLELLLSPAVPLLAAVLPCRFGGCGGASGGPQAAAGGEIAGCRVRRPRR